MKEDTPATATATATLDWERQRRHTWFSKIHPNAISIVGDCELQKQQKSRLIPPQGIVFV
jgi:hypothetical protein